MRAEYTQNTPINFRTLTSIHGTYKHIRRQIQLACHHQFLNAETNFMSFVQLTIDSHTLIEFAHENNATSRLNVILYDHSCSL